MKDLKSTWFSFLSFGMLCLASVPVAAQSGALQFDGTADYVTFGSASALGAGTFTVETWFKRTGPGVATGTGSGGLTAVPLMAKGRSENDGSNVDMNWFLGLSGDKLAADFEDMGSGLNHPVTGATPIVLDQWYHAAVTYDGTTWRLYLNGTLEATLAANATPRSNSIQHASLASALNSTGVASGYFQGVLDEARVWNYARSADEIATGRLTPIPSALGLVGRWALDEATGTMAADTSGNRVHGTLIGGPVWTTGSPMLPVPTVSLVSPADQSVVPGPTITFTGQAQDELGLTSATLYVGQPARSFTFSGPAQTEDTYISADAPNANYGTATSLNVDGATPHAHGLMRFLNVFGSAPGQVPPQSPIASAILRLNCNNYGALMKAYRLTQNWGQNAATWNQCSSGVSWVNPGADGLGSHATLELSADCTATGWRTIDVTAFVQEWSNGSENYGIVLVDSGTDGVDFYSSESASPPELIITLQPAQPLAAVATQTLSGTSATFSFTVPLQDSTDYVWNCQVQNSTGQQSWAPANFRLTVDGNYPDFPTVIAPASGATGVATSPTLEVRVTDPNTDALSVQIYGRTAQIDDPDFTIVVLPDTQNYSASYPAIFTAQTQWIVNNQAARNIVFVAQEGDVVDSPTTAQYGNANTSMSLLDGVVPYGLLRGNHETDSAMFNQYFPYTRYAGYSWYGGHYPANANDNSFQLFTVGRQKFLVLHLSFMPSSAVITWAQGVISSHSDYKVIIVTHAYVDESGNLTNGLDGTSTQYMWDGLVQPYANVCMVLCGHEHAEITRLDRTTDGRLVPQLLADYQTYANGGNGYLRLLRFSPSQNKVFVQTYSPYLSQYETDANSEFTLDVPLNEFKLIATQTGVASGSTASTIWADLALGTTYEWQAVVTDPTGRSTAGSTWSFTTRTSVNTAPSIAITGPTEGTVYPADPASVTITATASDTDGTIASVEFFSGTTSLGVATLPPYSVTASLGAGTHTLTAVATDDGGAQTISSPVHITVGGPPSAPGNLVAAAQSTTGILLTWTDSSASENGFEIYQSFTGTEYTSIGTVDPNTTSITITGLQPSTTYYFIVRAFNGAGGANSAPASATTLTPPPVPAAPSGLTAAPASDTAIDLSWTDNSTDETGFQIERSPDGASWAVVGTVGAGTTTVRNTDLVSGTVYYYRVSACNESGCSVPSAMTAAAPFIYSFATGEITVTGTLTGNRANTVADDSVYEQLTEKLAGGKPSTRYSALEHKWTFTVTPGQSVSFFLQAHQPISAEGDRFVFAYSTDDSTYQDMATTVLPASDDGSYQFFALPATLQGAVYVRVQDSDHTAGKTALDNLYVDHLLIRSDVSPVMAPPAAPVLQPATAGNETVTLTWAATSGATSYTVWRKSGNNEYAPVAAGLTATTYTDTGLANGTTYQYAVTAHNTFGASAYSSPVSATPQAPTVTQPPSNLAATGAKRKISLNWIQSPTAGITQNKIYRSTTSSGTYALLTTVPAATSYSDSVPSGTTYYYVVTAVSSSGESAASNSSGATAK